MSGHQLAHAYGGRARQQESLSPPRAAAASRPTLGGTLGGGRAPVAVRPVFRPGGGDPPRLRGSRQPPRPSTAIAPPRSSALLRVTTLGDAPPPTPPPQVTQALTLALALTLTLTPILTPILTLTLTLTAEPVPAHHGRRPRHGLRHAGRARCRATDARQPCAAGWRQARCRCCPLPAARYP